jgi:uncharacterized protein (UPF0264 family)
MQLLVSVANADDARAALAGGADIIDAKDPHAGALGAVSLDAFRGIASTVGASRSLSAALGDANSDAAIECLARDYSEAGAAFVKVGFAGVADIAQVRSLLRAAVRGAAIAHGKVVAVAYADGDLTLDEILEAAAATASDGVLIDTALKNGPGLRQLIDRNTLTCWISRARDAGLRVAVAGRLMRDDLPWARECGADIAGVRGAACEHGRTSRVIAEKVRLLRCHV